MTTPTPWVIPAPKKTLVAGVADMVASNDASAELVTYSLGSCLGVTIFDPVIKAGGLLHLMLPDASIDPAKAANSPYMFVNTGVPRLFQAVCNFGADRRRLVIKVAGGSQLLDEKGIFNIGERNIKALSALLARNGYSIQAKDVGGVSSRTIRLDLTTGKLAIKSPGINSYHL
jgi:chemotaxis protein CheD